MPELTPSEIEKRVSEVETSYQRQLALAGKAGYDPTLTESLKKDLKWLLEQRIKISATQAAEERNSSED
jgi:hypothetical protein